MLDIASSSSQPAALVCPQQQHDRTTSSPRTLSVLFQRNAIGWGRRVAPLSSPAIHQSCWRNEMSYSIPFLNVACLLPLDGETLLSRHCVCGLWWWNMETDPRSSRRLFAAADPSSLATLRRHDLDNRSVCISYFRYYRAMISYGTSGVRYAPTVARQPASTVTLRSIAMDTTTTTTPPPCRYHKTTTTTTTTIQQYKTIRYQ